MEARDWGRLKVYVESPPVLWVYANGNEESALSVAATNTGCRWVFQISWLLEDPCQAVVPVTLFQRASSSRFWRTWVALVR